MAHKVEFSPRAVRQFKNLSRDVQVRLAPRIDALANFPRPQGVEKLSGEDDLYRIRVGDYRVIYEVRDETLVVLVVNLGHRKEIYRRLK